jgi:hypothetical protein
MIVDKSSKTKSIVVSTRSFSLGASSNASNRLNIKVAFGNFMYLNYNNVNIDKRQCLSDSWIWSHILYHSNQTWWLWNLQGLRTKHTRYFSPTQATVKGTSASKNPLFMDFLFIYLLRWIFILTCVCFN